MSPAINYARDLIAEGYVGRVLTATMIGCAPNWGATIDRAYQADRANGANLMTITGGHQIDALCYCLGEFREVSAFAVNQRDQIPLEGTGEIGRVRPRGQVRRPRLRRGRHLPSAARHRSCKPPRPDKSSRSNVASGR